MLSWIPLEVVDKLAPPVAWRGAVIAAIWTLSTVCRRKRRLPGLFLDVVVHCAGERVDEVALSSGVI
jgi:hypothetical protein